MFYGDKAVHFSSSSSYFVLLELNVSERIFLFSVWLFFGVLFSLVLSSKEVEWLFCRLSFSASFSRHSKETESYVTFERGFEHNTRLLRTRTPTPKHRYYLKAHRSVSITLSIDLPNKRKRRRDTDVNERF